jgi:hypothetical protein
MAVGDVYRVVMEQGLHGQRILNVFHYVQSQGAGFFPQANVVDRFIAQVIPQFKGLQSSELVHVNVSGQRIFPRPPFVATVNTTGAGPGAVAGGSLPTSIAVTVTMRTQFAGQKYRGRVFIAGIPVTSELDSQLDGTPFQQWTTAMQTADNPLIDAAEGLQFDSVVWHRSTQTYDLSNQWEARRIFRNQRRRQLGKGE